MPARFIPCPICSEKDDFQYLFTATGNKDVSFIAREHSVVLCKNCGMCFLNPQHDDGDYEKYYEIHDRPIGRKINSLGFRPNSRRGEYDRLRLDFLKQFLPNKESKIIDIGSGYGLFLEKLKDAGYTNLFGIEPNTEAVRISKENFGFKIYNEGITSTRLPKSEFDVTMLIAVIEHFTDPVRSLGQIKTLLKPGGVLYVNTLNLREVILRQGINKYFKFVHTMYFTKNSLKNALRLAGFEIVSQYTSPAVRKHSTIFCPENFAYSELNIIARRPITESIFPARIEKENWKEIELIVKSKWKVDKYYAFLHRALSYMGRKKVIGYPFRLLRQWGMHSNPLRDIVVTPIDSSI